MTHTPSPHAATRTPGWHATQRTLAGLLWVAMAGPLAAQTRPASPAATPAAAAAPAAQLQAATSDIVFVTRQMNVPVEGRFTRFGAQVSLDPRRPEAGSVSLTIDTGSARFGSPETDKEVPKPEWLHVARFPQATFQSTAIKATGPGRFELNGKLTLKGITRDLLVPVQLTQSGSGANLLSTATGQFTLKRLAFKIGEGDWADTTMVADDITVRFSLKLSGLPPL